VLTEAVEGFAGAVEGEGAVVACHFETSLADMSAKRALVASVLCKRY
jgi:hypothetical protein